MATITRKQNRDGSSSLHVGVFVKPWRVSKTFCEADYPSKSLARAAALQWGQNTEGELDKQRRQGVLQVDLTTQTLGDVCRAYLADPEIAKRRYLKELKHNIGWWVLHYGSQKVMDLSLPLMLREGRGKLIPGRAAATVNRYLAAMRSCWSWARSAALVPAEKVWPTRLLLTEPRARVRYLSDGELASLLTAARAYSTVMHAAIAVSIACGLRKGELLRLEWKDIDFDRSRLRVLIAKNDEARAVHLPPMAAAALQSLKKAPVVSAIYVFVGPKGEPLVWQTLDHQWRKVRTAAKLENFRWHDLRHTCASLLAQAGASLTEVGHVLGHKSASVTWKYAHLVEGAPVTGHAALDRKLADNNKS